MTASSPERCVCQSGARSLCRLTGRCFHSLDQSSPWIQTLRWMKQRSRVRRLKWGWQSGAWGSREWQHATEGWFWGTTWHSQSKRYTNMLSTEGTHNNLVSSNFNLTSIWDFSLCVTVQSDWAAEGGFMWVYLRAERIQTEVDRGTLLWNN